MEQLRICSDVAFIALFMHVHSRLTCVQYGGARVKILLMFERGVKRF